MVLLGIREFMMGGFDLAKWMKKRYTSICVFVFYN